MREQKYANILDDYPEEVVEEIKDGIEELEMDIETKLSMTRELKFKEIHDALDAMETALNEDKIVEDSKEDNASLEIEENNDSTKEIEIDKDEIHSTTDENDILDEVKKNKKRKKELVNEDLYLTASFKPFKKRFRFKKIFKILFSLLLTILMLGLIGFFIVKPLYEKYFESQPKAIFDASLNYIGKQANNIIDIGLVDTDIFDIELIFDLKSNIEGTELLTKNKFGFRNTVDPKNEMIENNIFVLDDKNKKYGMSIKEIDGYGYYNFTDSNVFMKEKIAKEDLYDFTEELDILNSQFDKDDLSYLISANINILKDIITEDMLTAEKDEIEIDGKSISVTKNSLKLDVDELKRLEKVYCERVLKDEKLIKIESVLTDSTIEEVKESYKEVNTYEDDYTIVINIYTVKGNKFVGFDVEENGFRNIYYYANDGDFDAHINLTEDEDCNEGKDCSLENQFIIDLSGTKKDNYTEVEIRYNDEEIGTLDVREFSLEKIDFSYKLIISDLVFEGLFKIDIDSKNNTTDLKLSLEFNDQFIELGVNYKIYTDSKISRVDEDKVVDYTDKLYEEEANKFSAILEEKDLFDSFDLLMSMFDNPDEYINSEELEKNFEEIWA